MHDSGISVERGMEIIEEGERDILVHDGKLGPSVIKSGSSEFALMWGVQKSYGPEDVELSGPSYLSREDVRDILEESIPSDIDVQVVNPDSNNKPWVYNLFR